MSQDVETDLNTYVYKEILDAILSRKLSPGIRLSEQSLADVFSVSRTVIRRTLQRLAHERVVDIRPNKGATVANNTVQEALEVCEARKAIEMGIIRLVVKRVRPQHIKALRKICQHEQEAHEKGEKSRALRLSIDFHLYLADITDNEVLQEFAHNMMTRSALIVSQYESAQAHSCPLEEHPSIVDALEAGDLDTAESLMSLHLDHIKGMLDLGCDRSAVDLEAIFSRVNQD